MQPLYKMGHIPTPIEVVGLGHPGHLVTAIGLPPSAAIPMPPTFDQGDASSCTGCSVGKATQGASTKRPAFCATVAQAVTAAAIIVWSPLASPRFLYGMARLRGGATILIDEGAIIADVYGAMAEVGYAPESAMPYTDDPIKINEMPNIETMREAIDQAPTMVKGAHRIMTTGEQRVHDVAAAIAGGSTVTWGTRLDAPFQTAAPDAVWPGMRGSRIGSHAMVLWAYRTNASGRLEFLSLSSWGDGFGVYGSRWVLEDAIASADASDFWIEEVADRLPAAA